MTQSFFGDLRGAEAVAAIAPDEVIVSVPRGAALVVNPRERCPCDDFVDADFWKDAPWCASLPLRCALRCVVLPSCGAPISLSWVALADAGSHPPAKGGHAALLSSHRALLPLRRYVKMGVLLLHERRKGAASKVSGYISQLPDSIDTPMRWTAAEVERLVYPPTIKAVSFKRGFGASHRHAAACAPLPPARQPRPLCLDLRGPSRPGPPSYLLMSPAPRPAPGMPAAGEAAAAAVGGALPQL